MPAVTPLEAREVTKFTLPVPLNDTAAASTDVNAWNNTAPTSSVFTIGTDANIKASDTYVAYCFTSIKGYSKFGTYTGNASADGQFVYTGFNPAWLMTKRISGSGQWSINDIPRHPFNVLDRTLLILQKEQEKDIRNLNANEQNLLQQLTIYLKN